MGQKMGSDIVHLVHGNLRDFNSSHANVSCFCCNAVLSWIVLNSKSAISVDVPEFAELELWALIRKMVFFSKN